MEIEEIRERLAGLEADHGVEILYACESGSRAWGFASPDSDFDVRFLFRRPFSAYLTTGRVVEDVEVMDGDFDGAGWDLRKALRLLGRSNGALLEWLGSPIVYREVPELSRDLRHLAEEFSPRALVHHYRGMAKNTVFGKLQDGDVRPKDLLYALRACLAARWVVDRGTLPPVAFAEVAAVTPDELRAPLQDLLAMKSTTAEAHRIEAPQVVMGFLTESLEALADAAEGLAREGPASESLDRVARRFLSPLRRGAELSSSDFTVARVRRPDLLFFDAIAGSHAYGTNVAGSDQDRRGIFVAPPGFLLGLEGIDQCADARHDEVYYELGRFFDLALKSNPNVLELLAIPEECVEYAHPLFSRLRPELFLSRQCARTYGQYALGQIRKARGLNKKIVNPQPEERRPMLDFCHVLHGQGSVPVLEWLEQEGLEPQECGVTSAGPGRRVFAIYVGQDYRGLVSEKDRDTLLFSSVEKSAKPRAWMVFQRDAFRAHCKAHREYWQWVEDRNEERYAVNAAHGRGYDSKNLMHTFRLLGMALEIAEEGVLRVRRPDREDLLKIRSGGYGYDDLVSRAEALMVRVEEAFEASDLPEEPDRQRCNEILVDLRASFG